ncbi:MAG: hypothetical protein HY765_00065 [Rhodomicrobium sp.]|nr:hypothetical protein [Rhodomicrobium sp.]
MNRILCYSIAAIDLQRYECTRFVPARKRFATLGIFSLNISGCAVEAFRLLLLRPAQGKPLNPSAPALYDRTIRAARSGAALIQRGSAA